HAGDVEPQPVEAAVAQPADVVGLGRVELVALLGRTRALDREEAVGRILLHGLRPLALARAERGADVVERGGRARPSGGIERTAQSAEQSVRVGLLARLRR